MKEILNIFGLFLRLMYSIIIIIIFLIIYGINLFYNNYSILKI